MVPKDHLPRDQAQSIHSPFNARYCGVPPPMSRPIQTGSRFRSPLAPVQGSRTTGFKENYSKIAQHGRRGGGAGRSWGSAITRQYQERVCLCLQASKFWGRSDSEDEVTSEEETSSSEEETSSSEEETSSGSESESSDYDSDKPKKGGASRYAELGCNLDVGDGTGGRVAELLGGPGVPGLLRARARSIVHD